MPLNEQVLLDIQAALRQIDELERRLQVLSRPVDIPVDVNIPEGATSRLRSDLQQAEGATEDLNRELRITERELDDVGDEAGTTGRELEQAGRKGQSAFAGLGKAITGLGVGLLAAQGLRQLAGFLGDSVTQAINLAESVNALNVVFGENAAGIVALGENAADSFGLAASEFNTFAVSFSAFVEQINPGDVVGTIEELTTRIADFASVMNIDVAEAAEKFRSGLAGETEPLRKFGIDLSAAAVQAFAFANGIGEAGEALTESEKVQARYGLLLEETSKVQGDFADTSGEAANLQRRLTAAFEDAQAEIGEALLPAFESLLQSLPGVIEGISALAPAFEAVGSAIGPIALDFAAMVGAISDAEADLRTWAMQSGRAADSAELLAGAIVLSAQEIERADRGLHGAGDGTEEFTERLTELLAAAETSPEELRRLFRDIGNLDEFLDPRQIDIAREAIRRLLVETGQFSTFSEGARFASQLATDLTLIGPAAAGAGDGVKQSIEDIEAALARRSFNLDPIRNEIESTFDALAASMDAVKNSLRDDENEIVEDFATFFDNLERELQTQLDFARNIDILRAMGLDDLADQLEPLGPEFGGLVADAIANPDTAAEAERALDQFADDMARYARDALLRELLEQVTNPFKIPINIEGILNSIVVPGIGKGLIENIQIPGGAGGGVPLPPPGSGGGGDFTPLGSITNNFYTQPAPTTDTQRINQALRSFV